MTRLRQTNKTGIVQSSPDRPDLLPDNKVLLNIFSREMNIRLGGS